MRPIRRHSTISVPMPTISMTGGPHHLANSVFLILANRYGGCKILRFSRVTSRAGGPAMTARDDADLLADLTATQEEAVTHIEGPLLILAGPGSGKTRVITRRVAYLLRQRIPASSILAITFTNKAAGEMRQRVEALAPGNRVWISTFHSFGVRILRQYADRVGVDRNFTIYDQSDRAKVVKSALDAVDLDSNRFTPEAIGGAISKAKNQLLTPDRYASTAGDYFGQTV